MCFRFNFQIRCIFLEKSPSMLRKTVKSRPTQHYSFRQDFKNTDIHLHRQWEALNFLHVLSPYLISIFSIYPRVCLASFSDFQGITNMVAVDCKMYTPMLQNQMFRPYFQPPNLLTILD